MNCLESVKNAEHLVQETTRGCASDGANSLPTLSFTESVSDTVPMAHLASRQVRHVGAVATALGTSASMSGNGSVRLRATLVAGETADTTWQTSIST